MTPAPLAHVGMTSCEQKKGCRSVAPSSATPPVVENPVRIAGPGYPPLSGRYADCHHRASAPSRQAVLCFPPDAPPARGFPCRARAVAVRAGGRGERGACSSTDLTGALCLCVLLCTCVHILSSSSVCFFWGRGGEWCIFIFTRGN